MNHNKKKFWSLVFGAILANSYVWLVDIGASAPVPEALQSNTAFVLDFYSPLVTAALSMVLALMLSLVMFKGFNVCVSEHILWLFWPSLGFLVFTALTANVLLIPVMQAALPALSVFTLIYMIRKRQQFFLFNA